MTFDLTLKQSMPTAVGGRTPDSLSTIGPTYSQRYAFVFGAR
ncbi:MAG: hypothetical protein ACTSXS_09805 [Candidatus Thorarchaeota archaeon]